VASRTLLRAAEQLRRVRLDRSRPLWQMWLLPGLPEGRVWRRAFSGCQKVEGKPCLSQTSDTRSPGLTAVGIIFIGARFLLAPCTAAAGFGIAAWHDGGKADPYLPVKGVRDIASGLIAVILLATRDAPCPGLIRAGSQHHPDRRRNHRAASNGPKATVYGVHGATAVALLAAAALPIHLTT
jgi:hypothetical protein